MIRPFVRAMALSCSALLFAACGGGGSSSLPAVSGTAPAAQQPAASDGLSAKAFQALRPSAPNPASIPAVPMVKPPDDLAHFLASTPNGRKTMAVGALTFSVIPGLASQGAYGSDGSLYVLSTSPAGPDKYIYRYFNGNYTQLPGLASKLAPAPNGTLWVINSTGQLYNYSLATGAFTGYGGQSQDVAVDLNNNVYVISKTGAADGAIYRNSGGVWTQLGGAGAKLASQPDTSLYIVTSTGAIYNTPTSSLNYTKCPGGTSRIVPLANGAGFYALGYPIDTTNGSPIYLFTPNTPGNCATGSYAQLAGAGVDFAGNAINLAVLSAAGNIYVSPTSLSSKQNASSLPGSSAFPSDSAFSVNSNPTGLSVVVDGVSVGVTPTNFTPKEQLGAHTVVIGGTYTTLVSQYQDGPHSLFYNKAADTAGSIATASIKSVDRATASFVSSARAIVPANVARHPVTTNRGRKAYADGTIFVTYKPTLGASNARRHASLNVEAYEKTTGSDIVDNPAQGLTRVVKVPSGMSADAFAAQMSSHTEVASVARVQLRYKTSTTPLTPNNTHYDAYSQWYLAQTGMPNAWAYTKGDGIKIAVIDTGIDATNPNLLGKLSFAESVLTDVGTGIQTTTTGAAAVQDSDGHGTNVASLATAVTNNNSGWASVGWNVSLMAFDIFPPLTTANQSTNSAQTSDEAKAIYDAVANGADVISMSLGGTPDFAIDPVEQQAVAYAIAQGVIVVAANGNEGPGTVSDFPAAYPGVIRVGASSLNDNNTGVPSAANIDTVASYSNDYPTLLAPGGDPIGSDKDLLHWIYNASTTTAGVPAYACSNNQDCGALFAGSSQATPQVSGAIALALAAKGGSRSITPAQMAQMLQASADSITSDPVRQGAGRLNVYRLLASIKNDTTGSTYVPTPQQFKFFAYNNSGGKTPTILDVNTPLGGTVANAGTFRLADVPPAAASTYRIAVWYNAAGNGVISPGDLFGASGICSNAAPCASASNIAVSRVSAGFTLP